jgi:hypothetical protein
LSRRSKNFSSGGNIDNGQAEEERQESHCRPIVLPRARWCFMSRWEFNSSPSAVICGDARSNNTLGTDGVVDHRVSITGVSDSIEIPRTSKY